MLPQLPHRLARKQALLFHPLQQLVPAFQRLPQSTSAFRIVSFSAQRDSFSPRRSATRFFSRQMHFCAWPHEQAGNDCSKYGSVGELVYGLAGRCGWGGRAQAS